MSKGLGSLYVYLKQYAWRQTFGRAAPSAKAALHKQQHVCVGVQYRACNKSDESSTWVAMPAWSVPGSHRVGLLHIRAYRVMMSCSVTNIAWPMCSLPVTFGGGMDMENGLPVADSSGWNLPLCSHLSAMNGSIQVDVTARLQRCVGSRGISMHAEKVKIGQVPYQSYKRGSVPAASKFLGREVLADVEPAWMSRLWRQVISAWQHFQQTMCLSLSLSVAVAVQIRVLKVRPHRRADPERDCNC